MKVLTHPASGGEPLYNIEALSVGSRRLPRTSPRDVSSIGCPHSHCNRQISMGDKMITLWAILGSRLLATFVDQICPEMNIVRSPRTSQSGSPPGPGGLRRAITRFVRGRRRERERLGLQPFIAPTDLPWPEAKEN